uniref:Methyltransferase type 11 domain-containing protein n=2 Tax=Guillardia theta TaxID=55529 RepID=A0A7S4K894_GUITH
MEAVGNLRGALERVDRLLANNSSDVHAGAARDRMLHLCPNINTQDINCKWCFQGLLNGEDSPDSDCGVVQIFSLQYGLCGSLLENKGDLGYEISSDGTLSHLRDMEKVDIVVIEGCEKVENPNKFWNTYMIKLGSMEAPGALSWVEGTDPFIVAKLFRQYEELEDKVLLPLHNIVVWRNNALRGRSNNPHPPPWDIPEDLYDKFTMNGAISVSRHYVDESLPETRSHYSYGTYHASFQRIERMIEQARKQEVGYYGDTDKYLYDAIQRFSGGSFQGMSVVIMGSLEPWYEAVSLAAGASQVITLEYNRVNFEHPNIRSFTMDEYNDMQEKSRFDVALSMSSFEHDGLGRYGDHVDADGDLKAMKRMREILKPSGLLFLAVPVGMDLIKWNAHRKYGKKRLPLLLQGWTIVGQVGMTRELLDETSVDSHIQPVFVLRNEESAGPVSIEKML